MEDSILEIACQHLSNVLDTLQPRMSMSGSMFRPIYRVSKLHISTVCRDLTLSLLCLVQHNRQIEQIISTTHEPVAWYPRIDFFTIAAGHLRKIKAIFRRALISQ